MTLLAFAAERGRLQQISIDSWYTRLQQGAQQQTSRMPLLLLIDRTGRWTDGPTN